jgi:hypothetical protein
VSLLLALWLLLHLPCEEFLVDVDVFVFAREETAEAIIII